MSTRTSLGSKWVLANGAVDPNGTASETTALPITNIDAWTDEYGIPTEMMSGTGSKLFYMGNNEYWRIANRITDSQTGDEAVFIDKYNYNTNNYESIEWNTSGFSVNLTDFIESNNDYDVVSTTDYSGFVILTSYDHFLDIFVISKELTIANRLYVCTDNIGETPILTENIVGECSISIKILGGINTNTVYWIADLFSDATYQTTRYLYRNDTLLETHTYDDGCNTKYKTFKINGNIYWIMSDNPSATDECYFIVRLALDTVTSSDQISDTATPGDGHPIAQITRFAFQYDKYIIMLGPDNGSGYGNMGWVYNTETSTLEDFDTSDTEIFTAITYCDDGILFAFNDIAYIIGIEAATTSIAYYGCDAISNPSVANPRTVLTQFVDGDEPLPYISNIANEDSIYESGIILTNYLPEGGDRYICAKTGSASPRLPNISVENAYAYIKVKE